MDLYGRLLHDVLFPAWFMGLPVVAHRARKFDPERAFDLMARHGIRNVFLPPTALKLMRHSGVRAPCPGRDSNPQAPYGAAPFKGAAFASFATRAG